MPIEDVNLDDKLNVVKLFMKNGADITQLNTVRSALSSVKSGGLAKIRLDLQVIIYIQQKI